MTIGIIGAMSVEVEALRDRLEDSSEVRVSGMDFYCGKLFGKDTVIARCGIGKVFAAMCAQTMILRFGVEIIINTGVGGTLTPELSILDIAVADGVVQHDMDTSALGDPVGLISGINRVVLPTSKLLADVALRAASTLGYNAKVGVIASGDQFISSRERKTAISESFSAICCEMEGAAIGQVCYVNSVDCLIVRAISDSASGDAEMEYPKMVSIAAQRSQAMIQEIFKLI